MILSKGIGIDLGTTNSAVAVMDLTNTQVLVHTDSVGGPPRPRAWRNPATGDLAVGHHAFQRRGSSRAGAVGEAQHGQRRDVRSVRDAASPVEISSMILAGSKAQAAGRRLRRGGRALHGGPGDHHGPGLSACPPSRRRARQGRWPARGARTAERAHRGRDPLLLEARHQRGPLPRMTSAAAPSTSRCCSASPMSSASSPSPATTSWAATTRRATAELIAAGSRPRDTPSTPMPPAAQQRLTFNQLLRLAEQTKIGLREGYCSAIRASPTRTAAASSPRW